MKSTKKVETSKTAKMVKRVKPVEKKEVANSLTTNGKYYPCKDDPNRIIRRLRYICYGKTRKQTDCDEIGRASCRERV